MRDIEVENPGLEQIKKNFKAFGTGCPIIRCNKTPCKNVTGKKHGIYFLEQQNFKSGNAR